MTILDAFAAELVEHVAHSRDWSLEDATTWVDHHLVEARKEYREYGAPLGDTDQGFIAWLQPRHQPPSA
jgi:hypothetical protein